jgi:hypothetical protein
LAKRKAVVLFITILLEFIIILSSKLHVYEFEQGVLQTVRIHLVGKSSVRSGDKFLLSFVDTVSRETSIPLFEGAALIEGACCGAVG